jgi:quinolinate synthase
MYQAPLPEEYAGLSPEETEARILAAKAKLGKRLVILGHHYQRDEIIRHADYRGDSYKLAKDATRHPDAEFIVFCGVHFMAETADILAAPHQKVILPNMAAGCSMADMANLFQVKKCWSDLERTVGAVAPMGSEVRDAGYAMNSIADRGSRIANLSGPNTVTPQHRGTDLRSQPSALSSLKSQASSPKPRAQSLEPRAVVTPVTYINSAANLKAFVGEKGGTVCTSTNAPVAVKWALDQGNKVLFFPDQHLGRNTGVKLGYDPDTDMVLWDPFKPLGGNTPEQLQRAKFILWKGHCSVHKRFTVEQIDGFRAKYPGIKILVHPECELDVVNTADYAGSTEYIIKQVEASESGSKWAIGTEINLVSRLAKENPDKMIFCLDPQICPCSTMYRIHPSFLLWTLESLIKGEVVNQVIVPDAVKENAKIAIDRMLMLA